jgi:hypothetical protein
MISAVDKININVRDQDAARTARGVEFPDPPGRRSWGWSPDAVPNRVIHVRNRTHSPTAGRRRICRMSGRCRDSSTYHATWAA